MVYVADNSRNSILKIPKECSTRYTIKDSTNQNIIDNDDETKKIFPLIDFLRVKCESDTPSVYFWRNLILEKIFYSFLEKFLRV